MPDEDPTVHVPTEVNYDAEYDQWALTVDLRLKRLKTETYVVAAVATAALGLGFVAFKGITGIAKGLGELAQVTGALQAAVFGNPQPVEVARPPATTTVATSTNGRGAREVIDETLTPPDNDVAEPASGPGGELSDEVESWVAGEPISAAEVSKGPSLVESVRADPPSDMPTVDSPSQIGKAPYNAGG